MGGAAAAAFACHYAALQLSALYHFRMNASATSSTRRNHYAGLVCSLSPPFELYAKFHHIVL